MLVANLNGERIDAFFAVKGPIYHCPGCEGEVILKQGRKVVHHFAHKVGTDCTWAAGETRAHMEAKKVVLDALKARGLKAELEHVVDCLPGDRRADVMAWSPKGPQVAFELQNTPIGLDEIEDRACSYAHAGIAQIWIPFIKSNVWVNGTPCVGGWFVERYSPRDFERWVHGFNGKNGMWMYDPAARHFWLGRLTEHELYVEEWNGEAGYYKPSKRYKELTLTGPYEPENLRIRITKRREFSTSRYYWPKAMVAVLIPVEGGKT